MRRAATTAWVLAAVIAVVGVGDAAAKDKKAPKASSSNEKGKSGYIGVYMQDLTEEVAKGLDLDVTKGVLISGVEDDSPAAEAGLKEGDVIVAVGGQDVDSPSDLRAAVSGFEPGAKAKLDVVRDGKTQSFTVTVGERPGHHTFSFAAPDVDVHGLGDMSRAFAVFGGPRLGIDAREIENDQLGSYFGAKTGVLVLGVEDESVAEKAGVQAGDVIQTVGDEKVTDIGDLRDAVRDFDNGDEFTIGVLRHGKTQSLKATMDEQEFSYYSGDDAPMWRQFRTQRAPRAPHMNFNRDSMQDEIDQLKKEIQEMKEKLDKEDS
jgi:serine protease Do